MTLKRPQAVLSRFDLICSSVSSVSVSSLLWKVLQPTYTLTSDDQIQIISTVLI